MWWNKQFEISESEPPSRKPNFGIRTGEETAGEWREEQIDAAVARE